MAAKATIHYKIKLGLKLKFLRLVKPVFNNQKPVCQKQYYIPNYYYKLLSVNKTLIDGAEQM